MFLRLIILVTIFSGTLFASSSVNINVGAFQSDTFKSAAQYSIDYERISASGLGLYIGASAMQSSVGNSDMTQTTFPHAGARQYFKLNRLPFMIYLGGGFSINKVPSDYGSQYIGSHLQSGLLYIIGNGAHLNFNYKQLYGKTLNDGNGYSFDGSVVSVGIGLNLTKRTMKKKRKQSQKVGNGSQQKQQRPMAPNGGRRRGPRSGQAQDPASLQQAQKILSEMNWTTF